MGNTVEDDNQAFVVYVPPNNGDTSYQSLIRLGAGPHAGATQDETTTYNAIVSRAATIGGLSTPTYNPKSGIALLTPGTINMVATGNINLTSDNVTNSNTGTSYTVTQEANGGHIISASYTSTDIGTWATASFNQATNVAVTFAPLQASIGFVPSYTLSGPLVLSNNYGLIWGSTIGWSVQATMARVLNIGWRTVVSNSLDGSSNQYYTAEQASSSAAVFTWTSPVRSQYLPFDVIQNRYCKTVEIASLVLDALAVAYAAVGLGIADGGSPSTVQKWLVGAEGVAIACTALNGLLAASGVVVGALVDDFMAEPTPPDPTKTPPDPTPPPNPHNIGATTFVIQDGKAELHTGAVDQAPALSLIDATVDQTTAERTPVKQVTLSLGDTATGTMLRFDAKEGVTLTLGTPPCPEILMTTSSLLLRFGNSASITLTQDSIKINAPTVTISGANVSIAQPAPAAPPSGGGDLAPGAIPGRSGNPVA